MMKLKLAFFYSLLFCVACHNQKDENKSTQEINNEIPTQPTAKETIDVNGSYQGNLPCSDCDGIDVLLSLTPDENYQLREIYLGKEKENYQEMGDYTWLPDGNTLSLEGIDTPPVYYRVKENKLIRLTDKDQEISEKYEKDYVLNKIEN